MAIMSVGGYFALQGMRAIVLAGAAFNDSKARCELGYLGKVSIRHGLEKLA
jgi:hypothetical protein